MTPDTRNAINNRLQIAMLALESITEQTPPSIVVQRIKDTVKVLGVIGNLMHAEARTVEDRNGPLGAIRE